MTLNTFRRLKLVLTVVLAVIVSQSIVLDNYFVPLVAIATASLGLLFARSRVREVVADERDREIAGKSAALAIQIYSWFAIVAMLTFRVFRSVDPSYEAVSATLAFSTCFLILVYSMIFRFHEKIVFSAKRIWAVLAIAAIIALVAIFGLRFLSGEDSWICQGGQWVKHGNPSASMPSDVCK